MRDLLPYLFAFYQFAMNHHKVYDEHTFASRFPVFVDNLEFIEEMNRANHTFTLGVNQFADLTVDEFKTTHLGLENRETATSCGQWKSVGVTPPDSLDWRDKNIITPVKDQAQCGSCWAFAVTEVLESSFALKHGELPVLSPQELVDCESSSYGCSGGYPDHALAYTTQHGLMLEKDYPYTAQNGKCHAQDTKYKLDQCLEIPASNSKALEEAVSTAPVVVLIEADQRVFQLYSSGILSAKSCGTNIDHAVQLVGYGQENGKDYWLVRNSWGPSWGDKGYIKLERNDGSRLGTCGILSGPSAFQL